MGEERRKNIDPDLGIYFLIKWIDFFQSDVFCLLSTKGFNVFSLFGVTKVVSEDWQSTAKALKKCVYALKTGIDYTQSVANFQISLRKSNDTDDANGTSFKIRHRGDT